MTNKNNILYVILMAVALCFVSTACDDFLDRHPLSTLSPEVFFNNAAQVQAYVDEMYPWVLPNLVGNSYNVYGWDNGTDNQIRWDAPEVRFEVGQWRTSLGTSNVSNSNFTSFFSTTTSAWAFEAIYRLNFFFSMVNPKFGKDLSGAQNTITGDLQLVRHYIGEMYALRAIQYFNHYRAFGDFPIITEPLPDDLEALTEASKRQPRNEVARFILSDLDKAIELLSGRDLATTRINRDVALLIKSRVALHEGTWLKYFKGTAFVPNGDGWPGAAKNAGYQFPTGSIDAEINWFLDQAINASKEVAEKYKGSLTANTGELQQTANGAANPYFDMFATPDLSNVSEVLLWRRYVQGLTGFMHGTGVAAVEDNTTTGVTRGFVENFLMKDGFPTYAASTEHPYNDMTIAEVRTDRDSRLSLFLKEPGQRNVFEGDLPLGTARQWEEPDILPITGAGLRYPTGYALRKGGSGQRAHYVGPNDAFTGFPIYRSVEALLNYMEASYERNGTLDASAREYWEIIRRRALVSDDIDATIAATDMNEEAKRDWGAYSAGQILTDATLYNIRRERRSEFIAEGLRYTDLRRWRSMDQLITTPYHPEGMRLWGTDAEDWFTYITDGSGTANMSPQSEGDYIRPFRKRTNQRAYDGLTWRMAHYLDPLPIDQFQITAPDGATVANSVLYQNPHWPTEADMPAAQ